MRIHITDINLPADSYWILDAAHNGYEYHFRQNEVRVLIDCEYRGKINYVYNFEKLKEITEEIERYLSIVFKDRLIPNLSEKLMSKRKKHRYYNVYYFKLNYADILY